jgi:hypothetical protein
MSATPDQPDQLDPAAEKAAREKEAAEQATLPYTWKQTIADVDVSVPVPVGTRGKDLDVVITANKLKVGLKGKDPIMEVRLPLPHDIFLSTLRNHPNFLTNLRVTFPSLSAPTNPRGPSKIRSWSISTSRKSTRWSGGHTS